MLISMFSFRFKSMQVQCIEVSSLYQVHLCIPTCDIPHAYAWLRLGGRMPSSARRQGLSGPSSNPALPLLARLGSLACCCRRGQVPEPPGSEVSSPDACRRKCDSWDVAARTVGDAACLQPAEAAAAAPKSGSVQYKKLSVLGNVRRASVLACTCTSTYAGACGTRSQRGGGAAASTAGGARAIGKSAAVGACSVGKSAAGGCHKCVCMMPLPLTCTPHVACHTYSRKPSSGVSRSFLVASDTCTQPTTPVDSMREAVFMVSPKSENFGSREPTRPLTQSPVWMPTRTLTMPPSGACTSRAAATMSTANAIMRCADSTGSHMPSACTCTKPSSSYDTTPLAAM
mmetsp:Transcript_30779/g.91470  ORF Transcript_30779/g.91470 Transcript_30779/m.91470 type:complete len:343 (+) Transcript_30779:842-1870(+)